jgi:hypothetical protein
MKRAMNSWNVACTTNSVSGALTLAQTQLAEVLHWTSATIDEARSWAAVANDSANAYAARLIAAAGALSGLKKP